MRLSGLASLVVAAVTLLAIAGCSSNVVDGNGQVGDVGKVMNAETICGVEYLDQEPPTKQEFTWEEGSRVLVAKSQGGPTWIDDRNLCWAVWGEKRKEVTRGVLYRSEWYKGWVRDFGDKVYSYGPPPEAHATICKRWERTIWYQKYRSATLWKQTFELTEYDAKYLQAWMQKVKQQALAGGAEMVGAAGPLVAGGLDAMCAVAGECGAPQVALAVAAFGAGYWVGTELADMLGYYSKHEVWLGISEYYLGATLSKDWYDYKLSDVEVVGDEYYCGPIEKEVDAPVGMAPARSEKPAPSSEDP